MSSAAASVLRLSGLIDCDDAIWDDPSLLRYCCSSSMPSAQQIQHRQPQHEHSKHSATAAPQPCLPPPARPPLPPPSRCPYQPPTIAASRAPAPSSCSSSSSAVAPADAALASTSAPSHLPSSPPSSCCPRVAATKPLLSSTGCELYAPSASSQLSPPPADVCAICLEPPRCPAGLSDCCHRFCLSCIRRWACVTNSCPLCKASFSSIQHGEGRQRRSLAVEPRRQRDVFDVDPSYSAFFASVPPPRHILAAACLRCGSDRDDHSLLLCDSCDAAYHIYCLSPPLPAVPADDWFCSGCRRGQSRAEAVWQEARSRGQEASVDWEQLSPLSQFHLVRVEPGAEEAEIGGDSVRGETQRERGRRTTTTRRRRGTAAQRGQRQRDAASRDSRTREQLEDEVVRELFGDERESAADEQRVQRRDSGQLRQQRRLRRMRDLDSAGAAAQQQQEEEKEADEHQGSVSSRLRERRRQLEETLLASDSDDEEDKEKKDEGDEKEVKWRQRSTRKRKGGDKDEKEEEDDDADALQYSFVVPDDVVVYATDYEGEEAEQGRRSGRRRSSRGRDRDRDSGAARRKRQRSARSSQRATPTRSSERDTATAAAQRRAGAEQQQPQPLCLRPQASSSSSAGQPQEREAAAVEDISQASTPGLLLPPSPPARTPHLSFSSAATTGSRSLRAIPAFLSLNRQQRSREPL